MIFTQNYASLNRKIMLRQITEGMEYSLEENRIIETKHNYIDFDKMLMRKGAISADVGEKCIISLNMRDGILLCRGKGNPDWNYSSSLDPSYQFPYFDFYQVSNPSSILNWLFFWVFDAPVRYIVYK